MNAYKYLQTRREGPILIVTMVNPPKNLLNAAMVEELLTLADTLSEDEGTRVLVLTGGADGIFITHYDVGELSVLSDAARRAPTPPPAAATADQRPPRELHALNRLSLKLAALPQPVIAAVNGTAMGGGCELALACDFRIIARGGVFGLPEVRVGILPGAGGTQRMARMLGVAKAMELIMLGNVVDADEAARFGLAYRAVDPDRLMPEALALANELASRPRLSVALIKQCIRQGIEMPLEGALRFESDAFMQTMRSDDASRLMRGYLASDRPLNEQ
jgi:enoyl-CoA hydratase/carnithine racemase